MVARHGVEKLRRLPLSVPISTDACPEGSVPIGQLWGTSAVSSGSRLRVQRSWPSAIVIKTQLSRAEVSLCDPGVCAYRTREKRRELGTRCLAGPISAAPLRRADFRARKRHPAASSGPGAPASSGPTAVHTISSNSPHSLVTSWSVMAWSTGSIMDRSSVQSDATP